MEDYNNKTKAELLEIIQNLEKKVEQLSSESVSGRKERFRDRYSNRILDNLPDMLTVLDRDANIVELVSSPSTNHVEGTTADSITQSNIKDILPEDAYKNIRKNMEQVLKRQLVELMKIIPKRITRTKFMTQIDLYIGATTLTTLL